MPLRRIHRSDGNQSEIVEALRDVGAIVEIIGRPFDLLVAWKGLLMLADVKNPETGHGWTPAQTKAIELLKRQRVSVHRLETRDDAMRMLGIRSGNC